MASEVVHDLEFCVLQLKSVHDLEALKKLPVVTLVVDGNPLCDKFKDETSYVR